MSFVSFLKQAGLDILKGVQIFEGIVPLAAPVIAAAGGTAVVAKLDSVDAMVQEAASIEQSFAAAFGPNNPTGVAKLAALIPQIQQIVAQSQTLVGKEVADPALFTKAMQEYAQATVDFANSLKGNAATANPAKLPALPASTLTLDIKPISVTTAPAPTSKN